MNILIDPYMFEVEEEKEIISIIPFFQELIHLCTKGKINVYLYKEIVEKMLARELKPFPVYAGQVRNEALRSKILFLNVAFVSVVMNNIKPLDIEECGGNQNFRVKSLGNDDIELIEKDEKYFELLSILLHFCYDKKLDFSTGILTGNISKGRDIGDCFSLICKCPQNELNKKFSFVSIEEFEDEKDRAYLKLKQIVSEHSFPIVYSPEIIRGDHHNKLQYDSNFTSFEGLSRTNKSVLKLLIKFGLSKIIFGEFHNDTSRAKGTIITYKTQITDDSEIIQGWLFAETGYRNHVDLYLPKGVGENLRILLDNEFEKNNVERVVDSLY